MRKKRQILNWTLTETVNYFRATCKGDYTSLSFTCKFANDPMIPKDQQKRELLREIRIAILHELFWSWNVHWYISQQPPN